MHEGDAIDLCCADAVGGMAQALSRHADEAFSELPTDHHRGVAEKLFKALTEKGPDNREIRRPITLKEICAVTGAGKKEVATVIETFRRPGRSFLMPPPTVALESESLIDISHESLIRGWARLKEWVDEEARSSRIYRRLAETAVLHKEGGAGLWRDPDLQIALNWREQGKPNEVWARRYHPEFALAGSFLDESVEARDAQVAGDEARRRKEIKRSRITALVFFVAFLFSGVVGAYAFTLKTKADSAKNEALKATQHALAERKIADELKNEALARNKALDEALTRTKLADAAKSEALEQKKIADAAKDVALADALAQKKGAELAKNEALDQKKAALHNLELAKAETLKGQALGALKELKPDEAIKFFNDLKEFQQSRNSAEGESYAIAGIADIYRDRVPLALLIDDGVSSITSLDAEDREARAAAQYVKMLQVSALSGGDDELALIQFSKDAQESIRYYQDALTANKRNSEPARPAQDARILQNIGDLRIGLAKIEDESKTADQESQAKDIETQLALGIKHYQDASDLYKKAELYSEQGEVLVRIADVFANRLEKKPETKSKEPEYANPALQQVDPDLELNGVVNYYTLASAAFRLAKKPLLEAAAQTRIGNVYESVSTDERNRIPDSVKYFKVARDLYRSEKSHRGEAITSEKLAALYEKLADGPNQLASYKEAYRAYRQASLEPNAKRTTAGKADEMVTKAGTLLVESSGKEEANLFFEEVIARHSDPANKAAAIATFAEFYRAKKDLPESLKYYGRKREIWRQAGNFPEEAKALFQIGQIQKESRDIAAATASFDAARKAYGQIDVSQEKPGDKTARASELRAIAVFYSEHDKQRAVGAYEELLVGDMRDKNFYEVMQVLRFEGDILLDNQTEEGKAKAEQFFQRILDFYRKENADGEGTALSTIGDLYKKHGDKAGTRTYYERSRASYLARKNVNLLTNALKKIADFEAGENPGTSAGGLLPA